MRTAIVVLLFFSFVFLNTGLPVWAQETPTPSATPTTSTTPTPKAEDKTEKLEDVKGKIKELEDKISSLQDEEKSLSSQIKVMDNQINLTTLRVDAATEELSELTSDIETANGRIDNLEGSLDDITKVLLNRIRATYQMGQVQPLTLLLRANTFSDFLARTNYMKIAQAHDKQLIYDTQQAKIDYQEQKEIFEEKKQRAEALKAELEGYTEQLAAEKKNKQDLLNVTKNDEKKYQSLLASARAERSAIEGVIASIKLENGTSVSKGQVIAVIGNSGAPYCSTGPHLHLEVRKNGSIENPASYLRGGANFSYSYGEDQFGYYGSISPSGSWDWPIGEPVTINQGFGSHGYAKAFYPSGVHSGIDMNSGSSVITAPTDGTVYRGSTTCGGASMNYVALDHGDGVVSWYWHVR